MVSPYFVSQNEKRSVIETMTGLLSSIKKYCDENTQFCIEKTLRALDEIPVEIEEQRPSLSEEVGRTALIFNKERRRSKMDFKEFIEACEQARINHEVLNL